MVEDVLLFAAVGFAAQMIDGAIGMAYGLSATNVLLALGVTPAMASASVHAAEVCTTGASGLAHWHLGNVQRDLVLRLALPGMLGGILGAYVLVGTPVETVRVFVSAYLLTMGGVILQCVARISGVDARSPTRERVMRCERTPAVRARAYGSTRGQRWPLRSLAGRPFAIGARHQ
jgi:uncharacterized membrane protein YfcA